MLQYFTFVGVGPLRNFLILIAYVLAVPVCVLGPALFGAWLSLERHEFGPWDPRYLLLIRGTQVGDLDLVEPIAGTVDYTGQGEEGTAPAYAGVTFKTRVSPDKVIDTYSVRCRASGLAVQRQPDNEQKLTIRCERENATVAISIEAGRSGNLTDIAIAGWEFH